MPALSRRDVIARYPRRVGVTDETVALANQALDLLWIERSEERGHEYDGDRAGSCKFAALLSRSIFGGRLAGNDEHVFVVFEDGEEFDLNQDQPDVIALGAKAHSLECYLLLHLDYREALSSCIPRVERWANWVIENMDEANSFKLSSRSSHPRIA